MSARQALMSLRRERGLRREDMAMSLGVSQSYYDKVETGIRKPSRRFLERIKGKYPTTDMNAFFGGMKNESRQDK